MNENVKVVKITPLIIAIKKKESLRKNNIVCVSENLTICLTCGYTVDLFTTVLSKEKNLFRELFQIKLIGSKNIRGC